MSQLVDNPTSEKSNNAANPFSFSHTTDFTAWYKCHKHQVIDELAEYLKIKPQNFKTCNPLK